MLAMMGGGRAEVVYTTLAVLVEPGWLPPDECHGIGCCANTKPGMSARLRTKPSCRSFALKPASIREIPAGMVNAAVWVDCGKQEKNRDGHRFRRPAPCALRPRACRVLHDGRRACRGCAAAGSATHRCAIGSEVRSNRRARQHGEFACCRRATSPAAGFHDETDAGSSRAHAGLHGHRRFDPPVQ